MKYEGMVFETKFNGKFVVIKYINKRNVFIKFIDTGYECVVDLGNIRKGAVKDKLLPSVQGVGIVGDEVTREDGQLLKEYKLWSGMLTRCYSTTLHLSQPTYQGCSTSENFKYFSYFKKWCHNQIGFNSVDEKGHPFQLDKDILVKGNKIYSEDTGCFIPREINSLLLSAKKLRGESLIGVSYHARDKKYTSTLVIDKKNLFLGYFDTELEAFNAYKQAKEAHIKDVANKWKDKVDPRVYEGLMNYQVEITD